MVRCEYKEELDAKDSEMTIMRKTMQNVQQVRPGVVFVCCLSLYFCGCLCLSGGGGRSLFALRLFPRKCYVSTGIDAMKLCCYELFFGVGLIFYEVLIYNLRLLFDISWTKASLLSRSG